MRVVTLVAAAAHVEDADFVRASFCSLYYVYVHVHVCVFPFIGMGLLWHQALHKSSKCP